MSSQSLGRVPFSDLWVRYSGQMQRIGSLEPCETGEKMNIADRSSFKFNNLSIFGHFKLTTFDLISGSKEMGGRAGEFRPKTSRTRTENGRHGEGGSGQT